MLLDRHGNEYPVWLCGWPDGHPEFINAARLADPTGRRRRHDPPGSALRALPGLPQAGRQADTRAVGDRGPACSRDVAARSDSVPRGIWGLGRGTELDPNREPPRRFRLSGQKMNACRLVRV